MTLPASGPTQEHHLRLLGASRSSWSAAVGPPVAERLPAGQPLVAFATAPDTTAWVLFLAGRAAAIHAAFGSGAPHRRDSERAAERFAATPPHRLAHTRVRLFLADSGWTLALSRCPRRFSTLLATSGAERP